MPAAAGIVNLRYKSCPEMAGQDHLLYLGKLKVNRLRKYPLFIAYMVFVIAVAAVQINIFANGYEFVRSFLHIDFDPYRYDSVYWGSLCFSIIYLLALPRNKF
ncbi:hypothetical protein [Enterobacter hormaechei]|uniref:hypothetical protein n=1 Tax=Enterobacter hormaechei TaxID=158836 RepID=UPI0031380F7D